MTLNRPIIGVGNLSFGGSGKTLICQAIAEKLSAQGRRVGIVCRSYGAEDGPHVLAEGGGDPYVVGDEAAMIASGSKIRVASGADKTQAAKLLIKKNPNLDVVIVDDAFQHHKLHQDLKILIWPKERAALRDFRNAKRHADVLLVPNGTKSPRPDSETVYFVKEFIGLENQGGGQVLSDCTYLAVAGLGPESDFFSQVQKWVSPTSRDLRLPDHADYRRADIQARLLEAARGCDAILTTAKDAVKLARLALALPPIYVVRVSIRFLTNEEMLWRKIDETLKKTEGD